MTPRKSMTFNTGDFVILEHGTTGQIWAISGEIVFVCVPDNSAHKALIFTKHQLYQWKPDELYTDG